MPSAKQHIGWQIAKELIGDVSEQLWTPLISSNLSAFRYDDSNSILDIRFLNGREYRYYDVDADTAAGLADAPSPGGYFHAAIKDGYIYEEI